MTLTKELSIYKESSQGYSEEAKSSGLQLETMEREEKKNQDRIRMLEVDLHRLRREVEKN